MRREREGTRNDWKEVWSRGRSEGVLLKGLGNWCRVGVKERECVVY